MTNRTPTANGTRFAAVLQPVVSDAGFDLEQVAVSRVGRRSVVRVVVDADDGVSLDDIAEVSRLVSAALDQMEESSDPAAALGPYTLEVTSPGVDRPLTEPRHWRRAVGRLVRTRLGERPVEGRVASADEAGVTLDVDGAVRKVAYADLGPGSVQVEFARAAAPASEVDGQPA